MGRFPGSSLISVPADEHRLRSRGWDPAGEVARGLAWSGGRRCMVKLPGPEQKRMNLEQRLMNPRGRFLFHLDNRSGRPGGIPRRWLLLDDVVTTGATLGECARVLKDGGAERVDCLALAMEV